MTTMTIDHGRREAGRNARLDALAGLPFADLADALAQLDLAERAETFVLLPPLAARGAFLAMDPEAQATLLEELGHEEAEVTLSALPVHVIARLYEHASRDCRRFVRAALPADRRHRLERVISAPLDSVARVMNEEFVALPATLTVDDARAALRGREALEDVMFLHHEDGRLAGSVRVGALLRHRGDARLAQLAEPGETRLHPDDNRERAAHLLQSRGLACVAVVDADDRQVGMVRFDEAMDVLEVETSEDVYRQAGLGDLGRKDDLIRSERLTSGGIGYPVRIRLMFLMVTLAGGLAVGGLIDTFEATLAAVVALAVFIPLIMDMGGNVGTQSTTIFARGYALGHINLGAFFRRHVLRELRIGLVMGIFLGIVAGCVAWLWQGAPNGIPLLGVVVGLSLFFSVVSASVLGFLLPWLMLRIGVDHAPGADPFITTIKDFSALAIYFVLAGALLPIAT